MTEQTASTRKGFSFSRGTGGSVKVRVQVGEVDMNAGFETTDPIGTPRFREVELTALEWIDVVTAVSALSDRDVDRAFTMGQVIDLHMGPAGEGL